MIFQLVIHLLADIVMTKEHFQFTFLSIWVVLPKREKIVIWHHDSNALVVPALAQKFHKVIFYFLLSVTKHNLKIIASAIVSIVDISGIQFLFRLWRIEVLEVGHLIGSPCANGLAGIIKTIEYLLAATHVWVRPDFEHIVVWYHDSSAPIVPSLLISQCVKGPLKNILPFLKLDLKRISGAIGILVDAGNWMLDRLGHRLE